MKKKLHKALHRFNALKMPTYPVKKDVKAEIRAIADNYEEFNDLVFGIGCDVLARKYLKEISK